jgi:hypothetical protein
MKTSNTVLSCDALLHKIITEGSRVFDQIAHSIDLLQLIINPFAYISGKTENEMTLAISKCLEPLCRHLLYKPHNKRYELLEKMEKTKEKCRKNIIVMCLVYKGLQRMYTWTAYPI